MLIPYFAGSARQMLAQRDHWNTLGVDAPFALENVPMHINRGEAYHDDPDQAIRHLNWFRRYRWPRYQGLGTPVLDYEPTDPDTGSRSSWRWLEGRHDIVLPCLWLDMIDQFAMKHAGDCCIYNLRTRGFNSDHVTRPRDRDETIAPNHLARHADYTDIWCIEPRQLDYGNVEAFAETRKPVALWLRDSSKEQIEVAVEVANATGRNQK